MERDEQQLNGWRKFRFNFGALEFLSQPYITETESLTADGTREPIGHGFYVAVVDTDALDQQ